MGWGGQGGATPQQSQGLADYGAALAAAGWIMDANGNWQPPGTQQGQVVPPSADNPVGQQSSAPAIAGVAKTDPSASLQDQYKQAVAEYDGNAALQQYIANTYGYATWMLNVPELKAILITAAVDNWDGGRVTGALNQTNWWKQNGQAAREFLTKQGTDPGTIKEQLDASSATIQAKAAALGVQLTPEQLQGLAFSAAAGQWNGDQVDLQVRKMYDYQTTQGPALGEAAQIQQAVKQAGAAWLQPMDANAIKFWTDAAMAKGQNASQMTQDMNAVFGAQAAQRFPWMKASIDMGMTAQDYLAPYTSAAAKTLAVAPDSIDWSQPKWMGALLNTDPKSGQQVPANQDQFNKKLMQDPQFGYGKTQGAIDQAFATAKSIEQVMGKVAI